MEDGGSLFAPDFLTPSQWRDAHTARAVTFARSNCARCTAKSSSSALAALRFAIGGTK
jgi:hypothetical protein